jgi:predicted acyl esterase
MPPDEPTAAYRTDGYTHEAPDGTHLAIRVFRPVEANEPFPTLLQRTPYGRPETPAGLGVAARAIGAGYAVAMLVHVAEAGTYAIASGIRRLRYRRGRDREVPVPDAPVRVAVDSVGDTPSRARGRPTRAGGGE